MLTSQPSHSRAVRVTEVVHYQLHQRFTARVRHIDGWIDVPNARMTKVSKDPILECWINDGIDAVVCCVRVPVACTKQGSNDSALAARSCRHQLFGTT